jgi:hypothetical protein
MARAKESEIVAHLRGEMGTLAVKLFTELLNEKLDTYKDQLLTTLDPAIQGRAQECKDLLNCLSKDFT